MEITVLIDNKKNKKAYRSEHGLSILIEFNDKSILFDTGKTDAFIQNAKVLGKDLTKVDYVVFSHSHYDHTGGLESFLKINKTAKIILKKEALEQRWSISTGHNRKIGFPYRNRIKELEGRINYINGVNELIPNLFIFPEIKKHPSHTFTDSYLYVQKGKQLISDTFQDELFMAIIQNNKLVIFTGCAHNGVENMLQTAIDYTKIREIKFVIGGCHLNRGSQQQVFDTINKLKKFKIKRAAFNHCSGPHNISIMDNLMDANVEYAYAGSTYLVQ